MGLECVNDIFAWNYKIVDEKRWNYARIKYGF